MSIQESERKNVQSCYTPVIHYIPGKTVTISETLFFFPMHLVNLVKSKICVENFGDPTKRFSVRIIIRRRINENQNRNQNNSKSLLIRLLIRIFEYDSGFRVSRNKNTNQNQNNRVRIIFKIWNQEKGANTNQNQNEIQ